MERREQTDLEAEAERIAARRADTRTPGVVRRAFLARSGLTLRTYLALEDAASPVLTRRWPSDDPRAMAEAFCTAWATVFPGRSIPDAEGLQEALELLHMAVERAFCTVMPMRFPRRPGDAVRAEQTDGLGWAARLVGRFVALGWRPDEVLDLPMDQLFILSAAVQAHEGADCAGEDYRERETGGEKLKTEILKGQETEDGGQRSAGGFVAEGPVDHGEDGQDPQGGTDDAKGTEEDEQEL